MAEPVYHVPVLVQEVIEGLRINPKGIYVDGTLGGGGHARAILGHLQEEGRLLVFDQDPDAQLHVPRDPRVTLIPHNFRHLQRFLRLHQVEWLDGLLADLGVSSHQLDTADRGFSTRLEGALDMRMNPHQELTARQVVATYSESQLHRLFERYGEVTNAKTLARNLVAVRAHQHLETTAQFKEAIRPSVKGNPNKYLAQVFQALRMEVNDELGALQDLMHQLPEVMKPGGRVAIITFHSIEDRIVKNFFRKGNDEADDENPFVHNPVSPPFQVITKKPICPSDEEVRANPRSRSAKLRVAEKK